MYSAVKVLTELEKNQLIPKSLSVCYWTSGDALLIYPKQITEKRRIYREFKELLKASSVNSDSRRVGSESFSVDVKNPKAFRDTLMTELKYKDNSTIKEMEATFEAYSIFLQKFPDERPDGCVFISIEYGSWESDFITKNLKDRFLNVLRPMEIKLSE